MIYKAEEAKDQKGDSCILRSLEADDAYALSEFVRKGAAESPFFPWAPGETDLNYENAAEYICEFKNDERRALIGVFRDSRLVALIELSNYGKWESMRHRATIGMAVLMEAQKRGLSRIMLIAAMNAARAAGYEQLESNAATNNESSCAALAGFGFEEYGISPHKHKNKDGTYLDERRFVKWI